MEIKDLRVVRISYEESKSWILKVHYAKRMPSISFAFGLYHGNKLYGVCTFGSPPSQALCKGVCGEEYSDKVMELNRLVISEKMPKNTASYFVANSIKQLPKPSILVSYADTHQGHVGYVYQATNWLYTGLSAKRKEWRVKGLEHLHTRTISRDRTKIEMIEEFGDRLYFEDRPQKHRYIYFHGCNKRTRGSLRYKLEPYPKGESKRYSTSEYLVRENEQIKLFI